VVSTPRRGGANFETAGGLGSVKHSATSVKPNSAPPSLLGLDREEPFTAQKYQVQ
jgi:hypothetical protein